MLVLKRGDAGLPFFAEQVVSQAKAPSQEICKWVITQATSHLVCWGRCCGGKSIFKFLHSGPGSNKAILDWSLSRSLSLP